MPSIRVIRDEPDRGCGKRKQGGTYLMAEGLMVPCGRLPIPLSTCPTCSAGIKFARGWTWINPRGLVGGRSCADGIALSSVCPACPLGALNMPEKAGLLWIGHQFYKTPADFIKEAAQLGISRRVHAVPHGFNLGETWVFVAHKKALANADGTFTPAIFHAFRPERLEYVVKGTETEGELRQLEKRGLSLVQLT